MSVLIWGSIIVAVVAGGIAARAIEPPLSQLPTVPLPK